MSLFLSQYWPILLTAALGMAAVYLLLPRADRYPPVYGVLMGYLAAVAAGLLLIQPESNYVETILFYIFAGLAVLFGALMLAQRNPVHAALSFAMVVLSTCGLFLLQAAPFLMAATIIIYAGAIVVTFLFVIMLAQQGGLSGADQRSREPFLATVAGFVLLGSLLCIMHKTYSGPDGSRLEQFMDQTERAIQAGSVKEWKEILGPQEVKRAILDFRVEKEPQMDKGFFIEFRYFVDPPEGHHRTTSTQRALADAIESAQITWQTLLPPDDGQPREPAPAGVEAFREELKVIYDLSADVRQAQGSLIPSAQLPLSEFAGTKPSAIAKVGEDGKLVERLPAANVAGLGRALFTEYLLAVELAGTLLLAATIGAIAIAGRRAEGLR